MAIAQEDLQALDALLDAMGEATVKADWLRLRELDSASRASMTTVVEMAKAGQLSVEDVSSRLDRLQGILEKARAAAVTSRDEAAAALKNSGRTHQAAQAYLNNGKGWPGS